MPALCSRDSVHHPGAQIGCCLAFTWHWVIYLWGWLGRWFLKSWISLLALVLRMPVMQAGQLAESSLLPRSPALHQVCIPYPQPPYFSQSLPFGSSSSVLWHCPGLHNSPVLPYLVSRPFGCSSVLLDNPSSPSQSVYSSPIPVPQFTCIAASNLWIRHHPKCTEFIPFSVSVLIRN